MEALSNAKVVIFAEGGIKMNASKVKMRNALLIVHAPKRYNC
jgi:hypothetical protein